MSTYTQTSAKLFEIESRHIADLGIALEELQAKLKAASLSESQIMGYTRTALKGVSEYSDYLSRNNEVPGYSQLSQIHKDLRDIFDDMNGALSQEQKNNDFLEFDASQILKKQENHRKELCTAASDHTIGRLKKSGNELLEMARALNA